jgi:hypothetical protein
LSTWIPYKVRRFGRPRLRGVEGDERIHAFARARGDAKLAERVADHLAIGCRQFDGEVGVVRDGVVVAHLDLQAKSGAGAIDPEWIDTAAPGGDVECLMSADTHAAIKTGTGIPAGVALGIGDANRDRVGRRTRAQKTADLDARRKIAVRLKCHVGAVDPNVTFLLRGVDDQFEAVARGAFGIREVAPIPANAAAKIAGRGTFRRRGVVRARDIFSRGQILHTPVVRQIDRTPAGVA